MLNIYLIRHAESDINLKPDIVWGCMPESPLTPLGKFQARALGKYFQKMGVSLDYVFTSSAVRAKDTAKLACEELGIPSQKILLSEGLLGISRGAWEGKPREKLPDVHHLRNWHFRPPQGESFHDGEERMYQFLEQNILSKTHQANIAIFGHQCTIRALLRKLFESDPIAIQNILLDHSAVTHLQYNSFGWRSVAVNTTPHLKWLKE